MARFDTRSRRRTHSSRKNIKGRSRGMSGVRGFVSLERYMLESAAWIATSPQARSVYIEIERRFNGANNGAIPLSAREAAELCGISKNTAPKCFRELMEKGFVEQVKCGQFSMKVRHASEWRLTIRQNNVTGEPPKKQFLKWRPLAGEIAEHVTKGGTHRYQRGDKSDA